MWCHPQGSSAFYVCNCTVLSSHGLNTVIIQRRGFTNMQQLSCSWIGSTAKNQRWNLRSLIYTSWKPGLRCFWKKSKQISSGALIHFHFRALAGKWNSIQMAVNANLKLKLKGFVGRCCYCEFLKRACPQEQPGRRRCGRAASPPNWQQLGSQDILRLCN